MHLPHNPNPTHRVAHTRQSQFFRINTTNFIFIWRTIYTHFHEIVLDLDIIGYNCFQF